MSYLIVTLKRALDCLLFPFLFILYFALLILSKYKPSSGKTSEVHCSFSILSVFKSLPEKVKPAFFSLGLQRPGAHSGNEHCRTSVSSGGLRFDFRRRASSGDPLQARR